MRVVVAVAIGIPVGIEVSVRVRQGVCRDIHRYGDLDS